MLGPNLRMQKNWEYPPPPPHTHTGDKTNTKTRPLIYTRALTYAKLASNCRCYTHQRFIPDDKNKNRNAWFLILTPYSFPTLPAKHTILQLYFNYTDIPYSQNTHWRRYWLNKGISVKCLFLFSTQGANTCSFVWFDSLRLINNLSVKQGRVFLGWTSTKLG